MAPKLLFQLLLDTFATFLIKDMQVFGRHNNSKLVKNLFQAILVTFEKKIHTMLSVNPFQED